VKQGNTGSVSSSASEQVHDTLQYLFTSPLKPAAPTYDCFGSPNSADGTTVDRVCKAIIEQSTKDVVHLHLNECAKANKKKSNEQQAIETLDSRIIRVLDAIKKSGMDWSVLVCTDGSVTCTNATSNLMVMAPTPLLGAKNPDADIESLELDNSAYLAEEEFPPYEAKDWAMMGVRFCCLLSLLYLFIFGLDLMGTSFKVLGGTQAGDLFSAVDNPIAGLMVGVLATVLVQSSSTSTSVVVGMVGADIISVKDAIPVIMGANIGTSVTNTIVSMGQMNDIKQLELAFSGATVHDCFNFLAVSVLLPIECATDMLYYLTDAMTDGLDGSEGGKFKGPLKYIVSPLTKEWIQADKKKINKIAEGKLDSSTAGSLVKGGFVESWSDDAGASFCLICSLVILCIALFGIVKLLQYMVLGRAQNVIKKALKFSETWWGGYLAIIVGLGVTIAVQSSSITTSTLTPLVGVGVITIQQMYPLTLGANVGTTCTALLAALVSEKKAALQIALAHLMFNIISTLMFYPIPITRLPIPMCQFLGSMVVSLGRWFPIAYLIFFFFLLPLLVFGLTALFTDAGTVGVAFGVILTTILVAALAYFIYWWNYKEGRQWVIDKAQLICGPIKEKEDDADDEFEEEIEDHKAKNPLPVVIDEEEKKSTPGVELQQADEM
jgi:sodium-dependent phosphate cotransporter